MVDHKNRLSLTLKGCPVNRWTHSFGLKNQCDLPQVASYDPLAETVAPAETTTEGQSTGGQAQTETADAAQKNLREVALFQFLFVKLLDER